MHIDYLIKSFEMKIIMCYQYCMLLRFVFMQLSALLDHLNTYKCEFNVCGCVIHVYDIVLFMLFVCSFPGFMCFACFAQTWAHKFVHL